MYTLHEANPFLKSAYVFEGSPNALVNVVPADNVVQMKFCSVCTQTSHLLTDFYTINNGCVGGCGLMVNALTIINRCSLFQIASHHYLMAQLRGALRLYTLYVTLYSLNLVTVYASFS